MNQTFSEKLAEYLRLREIELDGIRRRSDEVRALDERRMAQLEHEMDEMVQGVQG